MNMKGLKKTSPTQFEILLNFIEQNPIVMCDRTTNNKDEIDKKWAELTPLLNADRYGPTKSAKSWKKTWIDWKYYTKRKVTQCKDSTRSREKLHLNRMERRILALINYSQIQNSQANSIDTSFDVENVDDEDFSNDSSSSASDCDEINKAYEIDSQKEIPRAMELMSEEVEPQDGGTAQRKTNTYAEISEKSEETKAKQTYQYRKLKLLERTTAAAERRAEAAERKAAALEKLVRLKQKQLLTDGLYL